MNCDCLNRGENRKEERTSNAKSCETVERICSWTKLERIIVRQVVWRLYLRWALCLWDDGVVMFNHCNSGGVWSPCCMSGTYVDWRPPSSTFGRKAHTNLWKVAWDISAASYLWTKVGLRMTRHLRWWDRYDVAIKAKSLFIYAYVSVEVVPLARRQFVRTCTMCSGKPTCDEERK